MDAFEAFVLQSGLRRCVKIDILSRSCAYVPSTSNHMAQTGVQETSGCGSKNYTEIETKRS